MVMQMRGDNCYPGRGKRVKIPLLPENVGNRSLNFNYLGSLGNPWEGNNKYNIIDLTKCVSSYLSTFKTLYIGLNNSGLKFNMQLFFAKLFDWKRLFLTQIADFQDWWISTIGTKIRPVTREDREGRPLRSWCQFERAKLLTLSS